MVVIFFRPPGSIFNERNHHHHHHHHHTRSYFIAIPIMISQSTYQKVTRLSIQSESPKVRLSPCHFVGQSVIYSFGQTEPRKKPSLVNRDPDFMVYEIISLYNWVGHFIPQKTQPTRGPFFVAQMGKPFPMTQVIVQNPKETINDLCKFP